MPKLIRSVLFFLVCNGCFIYAYSQNPDPDSVYLSLAVRNAIEIQQKGLGNNLRLYNGSAYTHSYSAAKGYPFFSSDSMLPGDLHYDGGYYRGVPMYYDLVTGDIIISSYTRDHHILLVGDKISQFDFSGHHFVRLQNDSTHGSTIHAGFYDLIYSGQTAVYVKREKKLRELAKADGIDAAFIDFNYYFIQRRDRFYRIWNYGSLLEAFGDKRNELKKYLRNNNDRFKKNPELTLIKAAAFYDQLTTQ